MINLNVLNLRFINSYASGRGQARNQDFPKDVA